MLKKTYYKTNIYLRNVQYLNIKNWHSIRNNRIDVEIASSLFAYFKQFYVR